MCVCVKISSQDSRVSFFVSFEPEEDAIGEELEGGELVPVESDIWYIFIIIYIIYIPVYKAIHIYEGALHYIFDRN